MEYWKIDGDANKELWETERIAYEFFNIADAAGEISYDEGIEIAVKIRDAMQKRIDELQAQLSTR